MSDHLGGPFGQDREEEMVEAWAAQSAAVRAKRGNPMVPLAQLRAGLPVHRALMFKFLADASNVPCSLVGGGNCHGACFCACVLTSRSLRRNACRRERIRRGGAGTGLGMSTCGGAVLSMSFNMFTPQARPACNCWREFQVVPLAAESTVQTHVASLVVINSCVTRKAFLSRRRL